MGRRAKRNLVAVLDFLMCGLEVMSRRDVGFILAGLRPLPGDGRPARLIENLQARGFVERRGRGAATKFAITDKARQAVALEDPRVHWDRPWDGKWRVLAYDIPERLRPTRISLRKQLHAEKLGLLQRSLWVWPHDLKPLLQGLIARKGLPECFCAFESETLLMTRNKDIVKGAWDFDKIDEAHEKYQDVMRDEFEQLNRTRDLPGLFRSIRVEREEFGRAFRHDPCLPRALWPSGYRGGTVVRIHRSFRKGLLNQARQLMKT